MRPQRLTILYLVAAFLALAPQAFAATINVPADQPTIQAGINAASNGDTVLVAPGAYLENINFKGKNITVTSSGGAAATTIDGHLGSGAPTVTVAMGESSATLSGFTITGGEYGVYISIPSLTETYALNTVSILNNVITANTCYGIYDASVSALIQGNIITGTLGGTATACSVYAGAGVLILNEVTFPRPPGFPIYYPSTLFGNTIQNNVNGLYGGGVVLEYAGNATIQNNIIQNNAGQIAGGLYEAGTFTASIVQNLITGNTSLGMGTSSAGGISLQPPLNDISLDAPPVAYIANNTIAGNALQNSNPAADAATELSASLIPPRTA